MRTPTWRSPEFDRCRTRPELIRRSWRSCIRLGFRSKTFRSFRNTATRPRSTNSVPYRLQQTVYQWSNVCLSSAVRSKYNRFIGNVSSVLSFALGFRLYFGIRSLQTSKLILRVNVNFTVNFRTDTLDAAIVSSCYPKYLYGVQCTLKYLNGLLTRLK